MSLTDEIRLLSLEALVNAELDALGIEWNASASPVDNPEDALVTRRPHHSEGVAPRDMSIRNAWDGERPSDAARARVAGWARHLHRLIRRDAAIEAAGSDVRDPPVWSFVVQSMAAAIMRNEGRDPLDLVRIEPGRQDRTGWRTMAGVARGTALPPGEESDGLATGTTATLNRRRPEWHYQDRGGGHPVIGLPLIRLPETLVQGIPGRMLDEIVEDVRLAGSGARIRGARVMPTGSVVLILEKRWIRLAEAPAGIDTTWLDPPEAGVAVPTI